MKKQFILAFSCFLFLTAVSSLHAQTTRTVCASGCGYTSIQAAMNAAASGDTILLNVTGTFTEKDIVVPEKNLVIRGLGKGVTILQSYATSGSTSGGRIFSYLNPVGAGGNIFTVENMTIQNAYAQVDASGQSVGGVFYGRATKGLKLTFNNVRMYNNHTAPGAINNSGGACIYISATGSGYTYNADVSINNCEMNNSYLGTPQGNSWGACINLLGSPARLVIDNSSFSNNVAYNGGGAIYAGANWEIYIKNSKFDNNLNRASGDGGCFRGTSGNWNFDNCLFLNNKALVGTGLGGVWNGAGAKFKSCTFYNNAAIKGGAIFRNSAGFASNGNDEMQLINCTFYGNNASAAGRTIHYGSNSATAVMPLVLINSIVTAGTGAAATDIHFSLPYAQIIQNTNNYATSISTEHASPGSTPVFAFNAGNTTLGLSTTLAANGGAYESLALNSSSTLINAGTTLTGATYDIGIKDQRNYARHDGDIDVGSFEYLGIADDATAPVITYTALGNTVLTTNRIIIATIADANGIYWYPQKVDLRPRIYFRKNTGAWQNAAGVWQTGNGISGTWRFTISTAAMGSLANGDVVSYYIIAQDVSTNANIISSPAGVVATNVNTITTAPATTASYVIGGSLPVKLNNFTARAVANNGLLHWVADEEINLALYELERSVAGSAWTSVAKLPANSNRRYTYTDAGLATGNYLYRLKIIDTDGQFRYSETRSIAIAKDAAAFTLQSNSVSDGILVIQVNLPTQLQLFDANGKMIWKKQLQPSTQRINVSGYARGIYFVTSAGQTERIQIQ